MISLKRYLDSTDPTPQEPAPAVVVAPTSLLLALDAVLAEMGNCSVTVCPPLGPGLRKKLNAVREHLAQDTAPVAVDKATQSVRADLQEWAADTAQHYEQKAKDVKDLLLLMARTAQSVGDRDDRVTQQFQAVTDRLKKIASLDDVTQIRSSIEQSASELKASLDRMASDGRAAIDELRSELSAYRARLEEVEYVASYDPLTGIGNRLWTETQVQHRIEDGMRFCAVLLDIDGFKQVNDRFGHMVGDELLKSFAGELRSACRSSDVLGRWGGDEFVVVMDCTAAEATSQIERLKEWVCGSYTLHGRNGEIKLPVSASVGMAAYHAGETLQQLLDRADAEMYRAKAAASSTRHVAHA